MMDAEWVKRRARGLMKRLGAYRYVLLVIVLGAVLLLWPSGEKAEKAGGAAAEEEEEDFSVAALEERLEEILGRIDGAGDVSVMLTVKSGMERVLAEDTDLSQSGHSSETVVVSAGSGRQEVVLLTQRYPTFQGALVVCAGGEDAQVRLQITQAVSALTGLNSGRIAVCSGT